MNPMNPQTAFAAGFVFGMQPLPLLVRDTLAVLWLSLKGMRHTAAGMPPGVRQTLVQP